MKEVKLVDMTVKTEEDATRNPASENIFSEKCESMSFTVLNVAWRNTTFDLSVFFDWSTLCPEIKTVFPSRKLEVIDKYGPITERAANNYYKSLLLSLISFGLF